MAKKVDCSELSLLITEMAMNIGSRPEVKNLDDVLAELNKHLPEIRRVDLVDAIVEATTGQAKETDDLAKKLNEIKQEARSDKGIQEKIKNLNNYLETGTLPKSDGRKEKETPTSLADLRGQLDDIKKQLNNSAPAQRERLAEQVKALEDRINKGDIGPKPKSEQKLANDDEVQRLAKRKEELTRQLQDKRAEKRLEAKIELLKDQLLSGKAPESAPKNVNPQSAALEQLKELANDLKKQLNNSTPARRKRLEGQIKDLEDKINTGRIFPKAKTELPKVKELDTLVYRRDMLKAEIRRRIQALKPKGLWDHIAEPFNTARAVMTSFDLSATLRQGGFVTFGRPITAAKSLIPMLKAFTSDKLTYQINGEIFNRPNAPLYSKSKLYLAPIDNSVGLREMEEAYMTSWAAKIPLVRSSERAYLTFLNKLRADTFDTLVATLGRDGEVTAKEVAAIANYINKATGRGGLGAAEKAATALNTIFFSPRYAASRFQLLAGQPFYKGTARTRLLIAGEYARYAIGLGVVLGLGIMAGARIERDPRSSDFGKLRFGNTRIDLMSGLAQVTVLLSRMTTGQTKTIAGDFRDLRGENVPYGGRDIWDIATDFIRSKLSPMIGTGWDVAAGENVVGEPVTPTDAALKLVTPMIGRDIYQAVQDQGVPAGSAMGLMAIFGAGLQTFEPREKTASKPKTKKKMQ